MSDDIEDWIPPATRTRTVEYPPGLRDELAELRAEVRRLHDELERMNLRAYVAALRRDLLRPL